MKKTFLSLLLLAGISTASIAQEGSVLVYGNAGFSSNKDAGNSKTTTYSFSPGVGYQFSENWTAGIGLGLNGSKTDVSNTGDVFKSSQFNVGPFVRYTQKLSDIFSLFGQANFNYLSSKFEPVNQPTRKTNGFNVGIIPAVQMNVKNGFALNFGFGGIEFGSQKVDAPGANSSNSFNFTFGQQVNFGISKNFGGKK
jgi:opacity protein-like surface antigen